MHIERPDRAFSCTEIFSDSFYCEGLIAGFSRCSQCLSSLSGQFQIIEKIVISYRTLVIKRNIPHVVLQLPPSKYGYCLPRLFRQARIGLLIRIPVRQQLRRTRRWQSI